MGCFYGETQRRHEQVTPTQREQGRRAIALQTLRAFTQLFQKQRPSRSLSAAGGRARDARERVLRPAYLVGGEFTRRVGFLHER